MTFWPILLSRDSPNTTEGCQEIISLLLDRDIFISANGKGLIKTLETQKISLFWCIVINH